MQCNPITYKSSSNLLTLKFVLHDITFSFTFAAGKPGLFTSPMVSDLDTQLVRHIAPDWQRVGLHMGVENYILRIIEADHSHSVENACLEMFNRWLSHSEGTGDHPRIWKSVLMAVRTTGYNDLVHDIHRQLLNN